MTALCIIVMTVGCLIYYGLVLIAIELEKIRKIVARSQGGTNES